MASSPMRELLALALLELAAAQRPNVLVLIMDDLRAFPGMNAPYVHTPNMLRLASRGVSFTSAFSNAVHCAPSRASFLTGRLPSRSGYYETTPKFWTMSHLKHTLTLQEHFKAQGYEVGGAGKIFHTGHEAWGAWSDPTARVSGNYGVHGKLGQYGPHPSFRLVGQEDVWVHPKYSSGGPLTSKIRGSESWITYTKLSKHEPDATHFKKWSASDFAEVVWRNEWSPRLSSDTDPRTLPVSEGSAFARLVFDPMTDTTVDEQNAQWAARLLSEAPAAPGQGEAARTVRADSEPASVELTTLPTVFIIGQQKASSSSPCTTCSETIPSCSRP